MNVYLKRWERNNFTWFTGLVVSYCSPLYNEDLVFAVLYEIPPLTFLQIKFTLIFAVLPHTIDYVLLLGWTLRF